MRGPVCGTDGHATLLGALVAEYVGFGVKRRKSRIEYRWSGLA
jgi:hypothetical protein